MMILAQLGQIPEVLSNDVDNDGINNGSNANDKDGNNSDNNDSEVDCNSGDNNNNDDNVDIDAIDDNNNDGMDDDSAMASRMIGQHNVMAMCGQRHAECRQFEEEQTRERDKWDDRKGLRWR